MPPTSHIVVDEDVGGHQKAELRRKQEADEVRVESAGHSRKEAADHEGQELVVGDVDAEGLGQIVGQADALPYQPQSAVLQLVQNEEDDQHQAKRQVVLTDPGAQRDSQQAGLGDSAQAGITTSQ